MRFYFVTTGFAHLDWIEYLAIFPCRIIWFWTNFVVTVNALLSPCPSQRLDVGQGSNCTTEGFTFYSLSQWSVRVIVVLEYESTTKLQLPSRGPHVFFNNLNVIPIAHSFRVGRVYYWWCGVLVYFAKNATWNSVQIVTFWFHLTIKPFATSLETSNIASSVPFCNSCQLCGKHARLLSHIQATSTNLYVVFLDRLGFIVNIHLQVPNNKM